MQKKEPAPLELSVAGLNLLDADHGEYGPIESRSRIPHAVFAQLLWQR